MPELYAAGIACCGVRTVHGVYLNKTVRNIITTSNYTEYVAFLKVTCGGFNEVPERRFSYPPEPSFFAYRKPRHNGRGYTLSRYDGSLT